MSLNQRGKIVGKIVHPRAAATDRKLKQHLATRPRSPVPAQDVIEISSDEDEDPHPPPKRPLADRVNSSSDNQPDYKLQLFQKDQEIQKLKKRVKESKQLITKQKKEIEARSPKVDKVEEELTCDVCATIMWAPYRLTECGHVFCLGCLLIWFDYIHVRFLNTHPGHTPLPPKIMAILRRPLDFPQECAREYARLSRHPGPQYRCPSCRAAVTRRPIEDFKVKALVSWLGSVQGIQPPESRIPPGKGDAVFDGYSLL